jgi:hypothetical protein
VNARLVAALCLLIVAVFAVVAVGVVDARKPLDGAVGASFDRSFRAKLAAIGAHGAPLDCTKTRVSYYRCVGRVRLRGRLDSLVVPYELVVAGDECWKTTALPQASGITTPPSIAELRGCTSP